MMKVDLNNLDSKRKVVALIEGDDIIFRGDWQSWKSMRVSMYGSSVRATIIQNKTLEQYFEEHPTGCTPVYEGDTIAITF